MILMPRPPYLPFMDPRTIHAPGIMPLDPADWLTVHDDYAPQMAYRERLMAERPEVVLATLPEGEAPAGELLAMVLAALDAHPAWQVAGDTVRRPDGAEIRIDPARPMETMGRLVAEDLCLMLPDAAAGEYRLVAAVLCFPSRWLLAEKLGRPLTAIHDPVPDYDADLARRVNRMFEAIRPGRPLMRVNWTVHAVPELHLPRGLSDRLVAETGIAGPFYLRTERQTLVRLPQTGAVCFGIKTSLTPVANLAAPEAAALEAAMQGISGGMVGYKGGPDLLAAARAQLREIAGQGAAASAS
ncbi:MAG: DUF3445 domain-containing protein [Thermohalobaculum sp.]|nr:DUF3445 domain-containing protein [Thermohalobaculum sp.]